VVQRPDGAFTEFVQRHQPRLLRTAFLLTGDHASAEDLLQTALLKTYTHWHRVENPTAFTRRVLVTTQTSWLRRLSSTERPMREVPDRAAPESELYDERKDAMVQALATLPPRMRAAVVLRYYEDLSEAETARLMGCSVGTVKTQTSRGLARLREQLPVLRPAGEPGVDR
jgi:RNA polymerase sigma-70 factor (sigma-E family)